MFEETSLLKEFARSAERHLTGFKLPKRWVGGGLAFFLIGSSALYSQEVWNGPSGTISWFTGGNWNPSGPPTSEQTAIVNNGTTAQIGPPTDDNPNAVAGTLIIGETQSGGPAAVAGSTVQIISGGELTLTTPLTIGPEGKFLFSGGDVETAGPENAYHDDGIIEFDAPANQFATITGTGQLIVNLTGTLSVFSTNDTYSGATTLTAGTLKADSTSALSPNSAFTVNSILDLNGFSNTIGSLSGAATGIVTNNGPTAAALTVGSDIDTTFAGKLENGTNALELIKSGSGTLTLTGDSTIAGTTIIAGTLQLGNGGTTGSITGNVADNGILTFDRSNALLLTGNISGTGSVTQIGAGITTLSGQNIYSGATTISGGTLEAGSVNAFSPNSPFTVNSILDLHGFNNTIGSLSGTGTGTVLNNGATIATLTVGNDSTNTTFGGVLENGTGGLQLVKSGTGTLTLTGDSTIEGATINGGTLQLGNGGSTGSFAGDIANNGTLSFNRSDTLTIAGDISGAGNVTQIGAGTTILTGNNTYTGGTTISAGTLQARLLF